MNPVQLIAKKRDGLTLSEAEIAFLIQAYARGDLPDYQMAALAMAIYLRGMDVAETAALTEQMLRSGAVLGWPAGDAVVDKHSTGGVGDKVSLILAPLLACCGLRVPMLSGRGLGATGGTLDKLEAIPGFRTDLSQEEIHRTIQTVGCVITGACAELAPADRKLYALRDVTATVPSIPLITASIMSKKLAEGLDALVLDVKYGSGAFMKTLDDAQLLARSLVDTGRRMGVPTTALLTDMNQPLGRMCGNACEVNESLACLEGAGPVDLWEVTAALGAELLVLAGHSPTREAATGELAQQIASGRASARFHAMVAAQGGHLTGPLHLAPEYPLVAEHAGYLSVVDTEALGYAIIQMGGGRKQLTDKVDPSVGLEICVRLGERIERGQPLARLFCHWEQRDAAALAVTRALHLTEHPPIPTPLFAGWVE